VTSAFSKVDCFLLVVAMDPYNGYVQESAETSFWALELGPQAKQTFTVDADHVLHITMASFGTKLVDKERAPISMQVKNDDELQTAEKAKKPTQCTLCVLLPGVVESIPLNVMLSESTNVYLMNHSKSNTVYLTGYMIVEDSLGGYEGSSDEELEGDEEFDEEDEEEEEEEVDVPKENKEEQGKNALMNKVDKKSQKPADLQKGAKQTPALPQKSQESEEEEEDSDEDNDFSMDEDLSDDFDMEEDSEEEDEESEEENLPSKGANQKFKVGQKRNEPSASKTGKQPMNNDKQLNTPQRKPQQFNNQQKKQDSGSRNTPQTPGGGNQTTPSSSEGKLTPSQKKRLRKKRKKMEQQAKAQGSS